MTSFSMTSHLWESLQATASSPIAVMLLGGLAGLGGLQLWQNLHRPKLARSRFAKRQNLAQARKKAIQQMTAPPDSDSPDVALTIGTPRHVSDGRCLYIPDANRGIGILGGPGSGKTFSAINPLIRSGLEQGMTTVVYDYKYPALTADLAAYAEYLGYDVHIFAPGFAESSVLNPLDFIDSAEDSAMALQIAHVMHQNFRPSIADRGDPFFDITGQNLMQAVFQLAKTTPYPDLMMAHSILELSDLGQRVEAATTLNPWVRNAFATLRNVKDSEKTVSSISGTASAYISRFMHQTLLGSFCGPTTCPTELRGKTLLLVGMHQKYEDVIAPLLASVLHMLVIKNMSAPRQEPLLMAIDELATVKLPALEKWENRFRDKQFVSIWATQSDRQLDAIYGPQFKHNLYTGSSTLLVFNPQDAASARHLSERLGEEEVCYRKRSFTHSRHGRSQTSSLERFRRPLMEAAQILKMKTGECILINPHIKDRKEGYLPYRTTIKLPRADIQKSKTSRALWFALKQQFIQQSSQVMPTEKDLIDRAQEAEKILPKPSQNTVDLTDYL